MKVHGTNNTQRLWGLYQSAQTAKYNFLDKNWSWTSRERCSCVYKTSLSETRRNPQRFMFMGNKCLHSNCLHHILRHAGGHRNTSGAWLHKGKIHNPYMTFRLTNMPVLCARLTLDERLTLANAERAQTRQGLKQTLKLPQPSQTQRTGVVMTFIKEEVLSSPLLLIKTSFLL